MADRNYASSRFSELGQINTSSGSDLKVGATFAAGVLHAHEGHALVVGWTMYVVTHWLNILYVIDPTGPGGARRRRLGVDYAQYA